MFDILIDILGGGYELVRQHPATALVITVAAYGLIRWVLTKVARPQTAGGA